MGALKIAVRTLLRRPTFTSVAVLTLALGLGATAAMFAVVNGVVLEPLPYPEPGELVQVEHPVPGLNPEWVWGVSEAGWWRLREQSESLEELGVWVRSESGLAGEGVAEPVPAAYVTPNVPELLGLRPAVGRPLRWEDSEPGAAPVAVLSHEFWRTRFDADASLVGRTVRLEGRPVEVVGVMEAGSELPGYRPGVWLPLSVSRERRPVNSHYLSALGRLEAGISAAAAETELRSIVARFTEMMPEAYYPEFMERSAFDVRVVPMREHVVGDVASTLWVLLGAVAMVLLIGCANVANLFMVRLEAARREHAVRTAMGASRWQVARSSVTESVVLAVAAAVLALLLAWWGLEALLRLGPELPRLESVELGWEAVLLTLATATVAGVVFGLVPASRPRLSFEALREGVGLTPSRRRHGVRSGLVVAEIALALVVLTGAALMLRTFQNLRGVDPGFEAEGVLTVQVSLPAATYGDEASVGRFYRELVTRAEALPGVAAAGATQALPLASGAGCALVFVDDPAARERTGECFASTVRVTPGYFRAMGIAVDGTEPGWEDVEARRGGVVVSQPLADRVWPGQDPTGQGIKGNGGEPPFYRVTGVAAPVRATGLDEPAVPRVYFPMYALEGAPLWGAPRGMTLIVRSAGPRPSTLATPVRDLIRELDPTAAVGQVRTMEDVVATSTARTRFLMLLLGVAAAVSLALGVIGLYGVISYVVEQRRTEIGIRIALGAREARVRSMVVAQAARLALTGVVVGGVAALLATRALASQLYDVAPGDPLTLLLAGGLLTAVALAAAYVPAARAARVEPMSVLRGE